MTDVNIGIKIGLKQNKKAKIFIALRYNLVILPRKITDLL